MTVGSEPKKLAILGVLLVGVLIALYVNVFSGDSAAPVTAPAPAAAPLTQTPRIPAKARRTATGGAFDFRPRIGFSRPEDRPDPATIDPTLRLDLLAKVQNVEPEEASRNLFQYGVPVAVAATAKAPALPTGVPKIAINKPPPPAPPPAAPGPPPAPVAPQMTFKYYGYKVSKNNGRKEAFLLDGDDIFIAGENDQVKSARYKVVKIGVSSITIEDTQFKSSQTIQLTPEAAAG
ncbi:MAG TPA: hypothetical protein VG273_28340 [Bryobacteraceae bacterium]|nr:hypothetical protein [Bryobacteraceae bacterium]